MVEVRFMTLSGKFDIAKKKTFSTVKDAEIAVKAYVEPHGFTCVKLVYDGEEPDNARFTAKTPNGRSGRNVAFLDWIDDGGPY